MKFDEEDTELLHQLIRNKENSCWNMIFFAQGPIKLRGPNRSDNSLPIVLPSYH